MRVEEILLGTENQQIEFKESVVKGMYKTLCAFSNTDGGAVLVGVADDKNVIGFDCSNDNLKQISDNIVNKLLIHPVIESFSVNGKEVLKIKVAKSSCPVSFEGRYYKRIGNTTREMQSEDLRNYFLNSSQWDCIAGDYDIDEIDPGSVGDFVKMSVKSGRMPESAFKENICDILSHLGLIRNGKLTNGAIILFGKNPRKYFINAIVRVGHFKDENIIIGDKVVNGNLFRQIEGAEEAILSFINIRYNITGDSFKREEIWDYPIDAIREALLNALVHRDYFMSNRQTQIKIFDDFIWFHNPGGLPDGISIDDLKRLHSSVQRNPLIADVIYRSGFIEVWGSGINRICKAIFESGLPEPEFKEEFGGFSAYFRKSVNLDSLIKNRDLNARQLRAVEYVIENGDISNRIYQEINSVSTTIAKKELRELVSIELFKKCGKGRGTNYKI